MADQPQPPLVHAGPSQDARDVVQFPLGCLSLVLWLVVVFVFFLAFNLWTRVTSTPLLMAGGLALVVAALPWLAYPRMVAARRKRRADSQPTTRGETPIST